MLILNFLKLICSPPELSLYFECIRSTINSCHTWRIQISELGFNSILIKIRYEWQSLLFFFSLFASVVRCPLYKEAWKNALTHTASHKATCSRLINGMLDALLIQNVPFPFFQILSFYFIPFLCLHAYKSNVNMNPCVYVYVCGVCIGTVYMFVWT